MRNESGEHVKEGSREVLEVHDKSRQISVALQVITEIQFSFFFSVIHLGIFLCFLRQGSFTVSN